MATPATVIKDVGFWGQEFRTQAERSLELLRAIEATIDNLSALRRSYENLTIRSHSLIGELDSVKLSRQIDEDKLIPDLEAALDLTATVYADLAKGRQAAVDDKELVDEDCVVETYDSAMNSVHALHDSIDALRWLILEKNADLENAGQAAGEILSTDADIDAYFSKL